MVVVVPFGNGPDERLWKKESFVFIAFLAFSVAAKFNWLTATTANSFSDIGTILFRNLIWTEDQQVSKNPLDFWFHTGTLERLSLLASPIRVRYCYTTKTLFYNSI